MTINYKRWRTLFWCCFGIFAGTAFCMKWMESGFLQDDRLFTIIGLEISYPREKVMAILHGLDPTVTTTLRYHLCFDFAFMTGVYPGIAALCMMGYEKMTTKRVKTLLLLVATLQTIAWGCDVTENLYLLKWIKEPVIGNEFGLYHIIVYVKWFLAIAGVLVALPFVFRKGSTVNK